MPGSPLRRITPPVPAASPSSASSIAVSSVSRPTSDVAPCIDPLAQVPTAPLRVSEGARSPSLGVPPPGAPWASLPRWPGGGLAGCGAATSRRVDGGGRGAVVPWGGRAARLRAVRREPADLPAGEARRDAAGGGQPRSLQAGDADVRGAPAVRPRDEHPGPAAGRAGRPALDHRRD